MRLRWIVLAFITLPPSLAAAHSSYSQTSPDYSHCNCHFGYGDICVPAVSCASEGGRCSGSCVPSPQSESPTAAPATNTSAVSADIAKKCQALAAKAYPPRIPGNPAAGSAQGTGEAKRDYFNKCVTNGGNVDDSGNEEK
jgi:hypothetical protein